MSARRTLLVGGVGIALSVAFSVALVYRLTGVHPPGAPSSRSSEAQLPPATGIAAAGGAPRAAQAPAPLPAPAPAPAPAAAAAAAPAAGASRPDPSRRPPPASAGAAAAAPDTLRVSFRLDPRLTKGLHMGERWSSPPTYVAARSGGVFTVDARALGPAGLEHPGRSPTWLAAEPDMVTVSPDRGNRVAITVLRAGESTLTVSEGERSRSLTVKAVQREGVWRVDISQ